MGGGVGDSSASGKKKKKKEEKLDEDTFVIGSDHEENDETRDMRVSPIDPTPETQKQVVETEMVKIDVEDIQVDVSTPGGHGEDESKKGTASGGGGGEWTGPGRKSVKLTSPKKKGERKSCPAEEFGESNDGWCVYHGDITY